MANPYAPEEWHERGIHWHAFVEKRRPPSTMRAGHRRERLSQPPQTVLWTPWSVADWIDARTRQHVHRRPVWLSADRAWTTTADENDLNDQRHLNYLTASRGDSIYVEVYTLHVHHDLFVEAVTSDQCGHLCTPDATG